MCRSHLFRINDMLLCKVNHQLEYDEHLMIFININFYTGTIAAGSDLRFEDSNEDLNYKITLNTVGSCGLFLINCMFLKSSEISTTTNIVEIKVRRPNHDSALPQAW